MLFFYLIDARDENGNKCENCGLKLGDQLGIDESEAAKRGYIFEGNPDILPMSVDGKIQDKFELKLAVNTDQYGRTFQDR